MNIALLFMYTLVLHLFLVIKRYRTGGVAFAFTHRWAGPVWNMNIRGGH